MHRVEDDHEFMIAVPNSGPSYCRIQVFTAECARSIVVATQEMPPARGRSLTNAAEGFAQAVWERMLPNDSQPPRWIQHYTAGGAPWLEVTFELDAERRLTRPQWRAVDLDALTAILPGLEADRGNRYVAPTPEPERPTVLQILPTLLLPPTRPFRTDGCMRVVGTRRHALLRRLRPIRNRDCCSYHGGNWCRVMRIVSSHVGAGRVSFTPDELYPIVDRITKRADMTSWEAAAVASLFLDPIAVDDSGWINGQHRAQAAIDGGCLWLLVERV